jgi:hypothetical protein
MEATMRSSGVMISELKSRDVSMRTSGREMPSVRMWEMEAMMWSSEGMISGVPCNECIELSEELL